MYPFFYYDKKIFIIVKKNNYFRNFKKENIIKV